LIPPWARDNKIARHTYNARLETVKQKPSYRDAWRDAHWAIVLADAFYEPCYETGKAVRWRLATVTDEPMGIAGLWQRWREPQSGLVVASFTMLTINADGHVLLMRMHKPEDEKRTPVVLSPALFESWLNATPMTAERYLTLGQMPELSGHPVGK
jgi:putative SOS response-associated peptidase YedK